VIGRALAVIWLAACGHLDFDPIAVTGDAAGDAAGERVVTVVQVAPPSLIAGVTSTSVAFPAPTAIGDLIVVATWNFCIGAATFTAASVADNAANPYAIAVVYNQATGECDGGTADVAIYYAPVVAPSSALSITVTPTGGSQDINVAAMEYRGLAGAVDTTNAVETPAAASPTTFASGSITTSESVELIVSVANVCNGYPNVGSWAELDGFTPRAAATDQQTQEAGMVGDRVASTAGMYEDSWTWTWTGGGPYPSVGAIAAFK